MTLTATDAAHATTIAALHAMAYEDRDDVVATGAPCVCPEENLDCGCGAYVPARRIYVAAENTHGWYVKDTFTGEMVDGYYDTEDEADDEATAMTSEAAHDVPPAPVNRWTCKHCGCDLESEGGLLVDVLSGDNGGTYDYCPESPNRKHKR